MEIIEGEIYSRVVKSSNRHSNRSIELIIDDLRPQQPGELEIRGTTLKGKKIGFMLSQCRDLKMRD